MHHFISVLPLLRSGLKALLMIMIGTAILKPSWCTVRQHYTRSNCFAVFTWKRNAQKKTVLFLLMVELLWNSMGPTLSMMARSFAFFTHLAHGMTQRIRNWILPSTRKKNTIALLLLQPLHRDQLEWAAGWSHNQFLVTSRKWSC